MLLFAFRLTDVPDALNVSVSSSTEMAIGCASPLELEPPAENEQEVGIESREYKQYSE